MKNSLRYLAVIFVMTGFSTFGQTVAGRVTSSSDDTPLPGVSVLLKGTTNGSTTDSEGRYSIQIPENEKEAVLAFSFIGYATQEIPVNGKTSINVSLAEDITQLGEVVVTALGISRDKKALGYAVSSISSEQINAAANTNFASALYGKAAGVRISSAPGGSNKRSQCSDPRNKLY